MIGGCGSSGTTLVRHMLNRHPEVSCGPESTVFLERVTEPAELGARMGFQPSEIEAWQRASRSQAEFIDLFQAACLARAGKRIWADKTPENIRRLSFLWRHFPAARFIHVIRDGRDVACSLRRQSWMKDRGRDPLATLVHCGQYWADRVAIRRSINGDPRYIELRYEELVREPEQALRPVLEFLGLDWSERILSPDARTRRDPAAGPAFTSSVGRWRTELTEPEVQALKAVTGPLLVELGYEKEEDRERERKLDWVPKRAGADSTRSRRQPGRPWWVRPSIEASAFAMALFDRRVPWYGRALSVACILTYAIVPVDPIPNRLPVIGHLDDLILAAFAIWLFSRLVPTGVSRELRSAAAARLGV